MPRLELPKILAGDTLSATLRRSRRDLQFKSEKAISCLRHAISLDLTFEVQYRPQFERLYDLSKIVLQDLMPVRTREIMEMCVFERGVMVLPLPEETTKDELKSRANPSIFIIKSRDGDKIQIGIQCNTLKSVEKLQNILDSFHFREKYELIQGLATLDSAFHTVVYSKKKPYNFGQSPNYEKDLSFPSNSISEKEIGRLFNRVAEIRTNGIAQKKLSGRRDSPEIPAIGIAEVTIENDEAVITKMLEQIKPIYTSVLRIKTAQEIRKAKILASKLRNREKVALPPFIACVKCNDRREFSREEYDITRGFCPSCGMRLRFLRR